MTEKSSEEKSLPASQKKLRDARKKGQVPRSRDLVVALATVAGFLYLWLGWAGIQEEFRQILFLPEQARALPFRQAAGAVMLGAVEHGARIALPLFGIVIAAAVLGGMIGTGGFVISFEAIKPTLSKIDPISGFGRIFSMRNLIELLKALFKTLLLFIALTIVVLLGLDLLMKAPTCETPCIAGTFDTLVKPLIAVAAAIFLAAGLADMGLQAWLFRREMRMTKTELKRERKEMEGDPQIRSARRRQHREVLQGQKTGIKHATVMIADGEQVAVGMRFVRGETPVPLVVCKGTHEQARVLIAAARRQITPMIQDPALARLLARRVTVGGFIPQEMFNPVATALTKAGLV